MSTKILANSKHRLDFGPLDMVSRDGPRGAYWFQVSSKGYDPGSPESVKEIVKSLLLDGDFNRRRRYSNRSVTFVVTIEADDGDALARGQYALEVEVGRHANTLIWTPPDGVGAPSVFEVVSGVIKPLFDDLDELRVRRKFTVTLECKPGVRPTTPVSFTLGTGRSTLKTGGSMSTTVTPTVNLDQYVMVRFQSGGNLATISIGGETIPQSGWINDVAGNLRWFIPTGKYRGSKAPVVITGGGTLNTMETWSYPDASGLVVFNSQGSMRSHANLAIYRSAGALGDVFLYTAPDPNVLLQKGVALGVFGQVVVNNGIGQVYGGIVDIDGVEKFFAPGTRRTTLGTTLPRPIFTGRPLGVPTPNITTIAPPSGSTTVSNTLLYPNDLEAAIIRVPSVTKKGMWVIAPTPEMPMGQIFIGDQADGSDAVALADEDIDAYAPLAIHPERSGLMVVTGNSGAVTTVWHYPLFQYNVARAQAA
jgi:hypothetical protein